MYLLPPKPSFCIAVFHFTLSDLLSSPGVHPSPDVPDDDSHIAKGVVKEGGLATVVLGVIKNIVKIVAMLAINIFL